ncbi:MAG TPA: SEC-C metal-binding domain-containing protein [Thermoanaerobaculia bacterium]|nr:SEC-C metal-binding domain-containing protein [Thermoanaerobaculia bacterium]
MDDDLYDDSDDDEISEDFVDFLKEAIGEALRTEDSAAFLEWMRQEAPERVPELFEELPDEPARRSVATELGRALWNAVPLPGNSYRPRPIPRPERNDPCSCGSGLKYKKCCARWEGAVPAFDAEGVWRFLIEGLPLEKVEELGEAGRVPRILIGDLATSFLDEGDAERALALVWPMFHSAERLDERDDAALNALLEAHDLLELDEEKQVLVDRLTRQLKPALRAVLWESLVRSHAVEGEMEEAWQALDKARQDDPESVALGPLEVSLLLAEGRTPEAGERARFFRERFRRNPERISEEGLEFLDKVAHDPEAAQVEFSFGKEVAVRLQGLRDLLARLDPSGPPGAVYGIEDMAGDPGAGRLVTPESLLGAEAGWDRAFFEAFPGSDEDDEDEEAEVLDFGPDDSEDVDFDDIELLDDEEEELDAWEEDRAQQWLQYLLDHPEALDSLEILEDLSHVLHELVTDRFDFLDRPILRPLLDRGLTILRQSLAARPEVTRLPEDSEPNGSALELISHAAAQASRLQEPERVIELLSWLRGLEPRVVEEEPQDEP